ncbi:hypothetical protein CSHISOI_00781 [Colletotrichum shisoi]|uniref:Uncharacterized protein n=1 Tax=Colletotrichum shisoi TaxID=2078593 RepID=A0A5Q4C3Q4_9PEZI|nr:hypothetical protein CSHISOI_00781 [Colletotrichum shisoi]
MGLSWPSLGRWTSRRTQAPEQSLEPLRLSPVGRVTATTLCYSPSDGHQSFPSSRPTPYDETFPSPPSTPSTDEHHHRHHHHRQERQKCPTGPFKVQTHGVEETEAILRGESSRALVALRRRQEEAERRLRSEGSEADSNFWARAVSVARRRGEEKTAAREQQHQQQRKQWRRWQKERRHGDEDDRYHHDRRGRYTDVEPGEGRGGAKEVNPSGHWEDLQALDGNADGADAERRSSMWRESPARTEKVPRLPSLLFPEFGKMVAEVGIPSTHEGSDASPVHGHHGDGTGTGTPLDESPKSMDRLLDCPNDSAEVIVGGGQASAEQSMRDGLDMCRPATEDFEGWQMNEENKSPHEPTGYDIPRPATGLGWYDDDEWSLRSTVNHFSAEPDGRWTDETTTRTITVKTQHFPVRKDSLHHSSPLDHEFSPTVSSTETEDSPFPEEDVSAGPSPSMSTIINNSNAFLQPSTEDDDDDDYYDWVRQRRKIQTPVSYGHVEYPSYANDGPFSSSISHGPDSASPASSELSPLSCEEEQDIDDLLDIYAATASSDPIPSLPSTHENDVLPLLPPWLPYHPSAAAPLATIARGLSLPPTTPFDVLQDHLARNANILRYLILHCIPSPSTNPVEQANDLVEPILPPPLPAHPSFADKYPQHPRRREYTRLLQAVRSVRWSAGAIVDMLAVVDFPQTAPLPSFSSPGRSLRPSTALPMFRKLRTADAQRKGCLTSAQLHSLHRHGVSLLDVLQMNDVPKVVTRGLGGRLIEAAESGALCVARDCNLLDEEGALLDLLADPDEPPLKTPGCEGRGAVGKGSGLRNCVDVNGDDGDDETDDDEIGGHDGESVARDSEAAEHVIDDDAPYIVSPLSPEATTGDHGWDHQRGDVSPLVASHRTRDLEALLHHVRPLSSTRDGQAGEDEEAAPTSPWMQHSYELGAAAASVVVDADALEDPAVRMFMQDMGFGVDDFRLAPGHRTSWGVDLGGMLSE